MSNEENSSVEVMSRARSGTIGGKEDCSKDEITKLGGERAGSLTPINNKTYQTLDGEELGCRLNLWRKGHYKYMKGGVQRCQAEAKGFQLNPANNNMPQSYGADDIFFSLQLSNS